MNRPVNFHPLNSSCHGFDLPPQLLELSYDSLAHLTCAVACSTWHSVPEDPLQLLNHQFSTKNNRHHLTTPPITPHRHPKHSTTSHALQSTSSTDPKLIDTNQVKIISNVISCTKSSTAVVLVATLYVARLRTLIRHTVPAKGSELRVLIVALLLAAKWLEDHTYVNSSWAFVSGLSTRDLGIMEFEYLALLQWDVSVSQQQFGDWMSILLDALNVIFPSSMTQHLSTCMAPFSLARSHLADSVGCSHVAHQPLGSLQCMSSQSTSNNGSSNLFPLLSPIPMSLNPATPSNSNTPSDTMATGTNSSRRSRTTSSRLRTCSSVMVHMLAASQAPFHLPTNDICSAFSNPVDFNHNLCFPSDPLFTTNNSMFPPAVLDSAALVTNSFNPCLCSSPSLFNVENLLPKVNLLDTFSMLDSYCQSGPGHYCSWDRCGSGVIIGGDQNPST